MISANFENVFALFCFFSLASAIHIVMRSGKLQQGRRSISQSAGQIYVVVLHVRILGAGLTNHCPPWFCFLSFKAEISSHTTLSLFTTGSGTSKQHSRRWQSSLPSLEGSAFWNWFQFGCVFQDNDSRVHGTRLSFRGQRKHNHKERGPCSTVLNVLKVGWLLVRSWFTWTCTGKVSEEVLKEG